MDSAKPESASAAKPVTPVLDALLKRVEKRADGWYLTVGREQRDQFDFAKLKQDLQTAHVLNADWPRIEDIITRGRGAPERIGPAFEYYNQTKDEHIVLTISEDKMTVAVSLSAASIQSGVKITQQDIVHRLRSAGIVAVLAENAIVGLVKAGLPDTPVVVGKGKPPRNGLNAGIEFLIEVAPDSRPRERLDGRVDFKGIETFRQVNENDIIARRVPPTPGEDGQDVYGKVIPAQKGEDVALPAGENTVISEDGKNLVASCQGFLYEKDHLICIGRVLTIDKDVDFSTGNIKYHGALVIKGTIRPGFKVEADEDILVMGSIEAADVMSRNGGITVQNGVLGAEKARLVAKRDIEMEFGQQAGIETEGQLKVAKHLLHCRVQAESVMSAVITGGSVSASKRIEVYEAGNTKGIATILRIAQLDQEKVDKKAQELEALEAKINNVREPIEKRLKLMNTMIRKTDSLGEKAKLELKKTMDEYISLGKKLEYVQMKRAELAERKKVPMTLDSEIVIHIGHPMVTLDFCGRKLELKQAVQSQRYRLEDGEVHAGAAMEGGKS